MLPLPTPSGKQATQGRGLEGWVFSIRQQYPQRSRGSVYLTYLKSAVIHFWDKVYIPRPINPRAITCLMPNGSPQIK